MARLGISVSDANNLLNNAFGQRQISTIYQPLNQYKVVMEGRPPIHPGRQFTGQMFVINKDGKAIRCPTLPVGGPPMHRCRSIIRACRPRRLFRLTCRMAAACRTPPPRRANHDGARRAFHRTRRFCRTAQVFQETLKSQLLLIAAAIATVYIVLGILYESYIHPLTILSTLPSAGVGALLALELFGAPFSLIALIGIMLLIGIVKKNAIMMVDFALDAQRNGGINAHDAIFQACLLRFRPIMMTTLAALFGALPLVLTHGDGAELRQPLGITIAGGLIVSQLLTLYTTPVVYLYFDRLQMKFRRGKKLDPLPQ
jgi:multidrug efflux pump